MARVLGLVVAGGVEVARISAHLDWEEGPGGAGPAGESWGARGRAEVERKRAEGGGGRGARKVVHHWRQEAVGRRRGVGAGGR